MSIDGATITSKIEAAIIAQEAGDFSVALKYLRSAKILLFAIPDSQKGSESFRWDRVSIDAMIAELNRLNAAASGIRRINLEHTSAD